MLQQSNKFLKTAWAQRQQRLCVLSPRCRQRGAFLFSSRHLAGRALAPVLKEVARRGGTSCSHTGKDVIETPYGHSGAVGWSVTLGSILMFAVPEKRAQLPALFLLLRMGTEPCICH